MNPKVRARLTSLTKEVVEKSISALEERRVKIGWLKSIEKPTLIVGGGRDLQVARLDFVALSAASPLAKTLWVPDMNHILVDVTDDSDNLAAYNQPDRALDVTILDAVAAFIQAGDTR